MEGQASNWVAEEGRNVGRANARLPERECDAKSRPSLSDSSLFFFFLAVGLPPHRPDKKNMLRARCAPTPAVARLATVTGVRRPAALVAARPAPLASVSRLEAAFTGVFLCFAWPPACVGIGVVVPGRPPRTGLGARWRPMRHTPCGVWPTADTLALSE